MKHKPKKLTPIPHSIIHVVQAIHMRAFRSTVGTLLNLLVSQFLRERRRGPFVATEASLVSR